MYRSLTLTFIFCCLLSLGYAQTAENDLKFDQPFTQCEKKWVVVPKKPTDTRYAYGYVYMDMQAGFTLDLKGFITVNGDEFIADTTGTKTATYKYRLASNWPKLALLPEKHFKELNIVPEPGWVKIYYGHITDSLAYNFRRGFNFNAAGDCNTALIYLQKAYQADPDYKGLIFELAYAYNALNRSDDAISLLKAANKKEPGNIMFYRELGYAYMQKNDADKAIDYYKQGLAHSKEGPDNEKGEMAFNMAAIYKKNNNMAEYKNWMLKAKEWSAPSSNVYKAAVSQGF